MATYEFFGYGPDIFVIDPQTGTYTMRKDYDPSQDRNRFKVSGDDAYFGGDRSNGEAGKDSNQEAIVYDSNGEPIAMGPTHVETIGWFRAPDGTVIALDRIEIGGINMGYVPSQPLEPGGEYEFLGTTDIDDYSDDTERQDTCETYDYHETNGAKCFGPGTMIQTETGTLPVEWLAPGDKVLTRDHGYQPVLWVGRSRFSAAAIRRDDGLRPVRLRAGALGPGLPAEDLILSRRHRVLVTGAQVELLFGVSEALAPCHALITPRMTDIPPEGISYYQLLLPRHEIIMSGGLWTESLLADDTSDAALAPAAQKALARALKGRAPDPVAARLCLRSYEARLLARQFPAFDTSRPVSTDLRTVQRA
ncbi:MAG: Hint domain-containing protein [Rhodobacteraceae bacterium]|nr:Hint domain-containing protein [Paracoccaceae bacterium]